MNVLRLHMRASDDTTENIMNIVNAVDEAGEMLSVDETMMLDCRRDPLALDLVAVTVHSHPLPLLYRSPRPDPPPLAPQNPLSSPSHNSISSHIPYRALI